MAFQKKWLALLAVPPFLIGLFVVALFVYMNATARPLHPDPKGVPAVTQSSPSQDWLGAVEQSREIVRASLVAQNLPGASVAVGAGGIIVWAEGFGFADLERRTPVAPGMRFRIGGASIPLTSAAVGLLLERERLHLDAEIQTYVPSFPDKQWPVTLRQLMGHLGGLRSDGGDEEPLFSQRCDQTSDAFKRFADTPLQFEPGTRHDYSTFGWILVSAAVEAAAKEPFFAFMRAQIFKPLDMTDTTPDAAPESIAHRATFYYPKFAADNRYGHDVVREGNYSCFAGAAAFLSTPSDLVRFGQAITSGTLLQPATVKTLHASQRLASGEETRYGLGWDLESASLAGEATTTLGHNAGFIMGGSTSLLTVPERRLVVAITTNTSFADTAAIALKIAQAFATAPSPATPPPAAPRN